MEQNSPPEVSEFLRRQAQDWHGDAKTPTRVTEAVRAAVFGEKKSRVLPHLSRRQMIAVCVFAVPVSFVATRFVAAWLIPNPTLAAITKAMSEVRTAEWRTETVHHDPETGVLVRTIRGRNVVDLERYGARVELEPNYAYIYNIEGQFSLQGKKFIPVATTKNTTNLRDRLRRVIFNGKEVFKHKEEWQIGEIIVDGRRLIDLKRTIADTVSAGLPVPAGTIWEGRQEIWADPETFRIVQNRIWAKYADRNPPHPILDVTSTSYSYEYDKPIPESTFQPDR
jgi:hypothetical protein